MLVQLPPIANSMMNVVSRIIMTAIPSTPTEKWTPHNGIQGTFSVDCQSLFDGSKLHHRPSDTTNSTANVISASILGVLAAPDATSSPGGTDVAAPRAQMTAAPSSGIRSSAGRIQCWYPIELRNEVMYERWCRVPGDGRPKD